MRILILGGTGYLGSKIVGALCEKGHEVICLKRAGSDTARLTGTAGAGGRIRYCNIDELDKFFEREGTGISWFINTACRYCKEGAGDRDILDANLLVPLKVFLLCREHKVRRCLTIDTGLPGDFNIYCKAKEEFASLGKYLSEQDKKADSVFYNILLENFYGEDEPRDRFLHDVIRKLRQNRDVMLTEGCQHRDFVHIDDVVRNIVSLLEKPRWAGYHAIPLGSGEAPTIRELMEFLRDSLHSSARLLFGAVPMRENEPDSVADQATMERYGIRIDWQWKDGILDLLRKQEGLDV